MTLFYIPKPTQYLNVTTTLQIIIKQQIRNLLRNILYVIVNKCSLF